MFSSWQLLKDLDMKTLSWMKCSIDKKENHILLFLGFDYYFRTIKLSIVDGDGGVGRDEKRKQNKDGKQRYRGMMI